MSKPGIIKSITGLEEAAEVPGILFLKLLGQYGKGSSIPKTIGNITKIGVIIGTGETKETAINCVESAVSIVKVELLDSKDV